MKAGRYSVCLQDNDHEISELKFKMQQGVESAETETKTPAEPPKKDDLKPVEDLLKIALDLTSQIHKNMNDLRMSGSEQQLLTESISTTVIMLGFLSVGIVLLSVAVQLWYLKAFFKQKKIL